jgi:hypothetical protein
MEGVQHSKGIIKRQLTEDYQRVCDEKEQSFFDLQAVPQVHAILGACTDDPGASTQSKSINNPEVKSRKRDWEDGVCPWQTNNELIRESPAATLVLPYNHVEHALTIAAARWARPTQL